MHIRALLWLFAVGSLLGVLASSGFVGQRGSCQGDDIRVFNVDTGLGYARIQEAIDANETLDGHVIRVNPGIYSERVLVTKSLSIIGQDRISTVIDGFGGTVVQVNASDVEIRDFSIRNGTFGILVNYADNAKIIDNLVSDGSYGIRLYFSRNALVVGNSVSGFRFIGIELESSGGSFLRSNSMVANKYNFGVDGLALSDFVNDIDESNTVNGKPVRYLINRRGLEIDSFTFEDFGYLAVVNSADVMVEGLDVRDNKQGLLFAFVANSSIMGLNAIYNWNGIYVAHSNNVSVNYCNANYNFDFGIKFFNSSRSSAIANNADNNGWAGIGLFRSSRSILDKNEANFNFYNLHIVFTNSSVITRNNASGLSAEKSSSYSIAVFYSHNNRIYHNAFSTTLLYVESRNGTQFTPTNKWDNGYEGNYWLDYGGCDSDNDGISDAPCIIGEGNIDNFPLQGRFWDFIVLLGNRLHSIALISNSTIMSFYFSADDARISLAVDGRNGTVGFCRVAVPSVVIQSLPNGTLGFFFGDLQHTLVRNWTDGVNHYWYFSYVHSAKPAADGSALWPFVFLGGVFATVATVGMVLLIASRRRRARSK